MDALAPPPDPKPIPNFILAMTLVESRMIEDHGQVESLIGVKKKYSSGLD